MHHHAPLPHQKIMRPAYLKVIDRPLAGPYFCAFQHLRARFCQHPLAHGQFPSGHPSAPILGKEGVGRCDTQRVAARPAEGQYLRHAVAEKTRDRGCRIGAVAHWHPILPLPTTAQPNALMSTFGAIPPSASLRQIAQNAIHKQVILTFAKVKLF